MGLKESRPSKIARISVDLDSWLNKHSGKNRSKIALSKMLADALMGRKGGKLI